MIKGEGMPVRVVDKLPAIDLLAEENIFVMGEERAKHQDIRELRILIVNLMPTKVVTETQLVRALSNTPLQLEITLLKTDTYKSTHVSEDHLGTFYKTFNEIKGEYFDGLIITGAPVEQLDFEEVAYWNELVTIMEWAEHHVYSTFHICWGAQAALYHYFGIQKEPLKEKLFGVYEHHLVRPKTMLLRGFDEVFLMPHSRHTTIAKEDLVSHPNIDILAESDRAGVAIAKTKDNKHVFVFGHAEYERGTLDKEYWRDKNQGLPIQVPENYYPQNNPEATPRVTWRSTATLLFTNWLNYYVYQETPYKIEQIETLYVKK